ncbi:NADH dehydrogenase (ubiquinone) complex I, assembly factor 6 [Wickerhamiella sorbophila]|uniref:NADH dehydrogenase (Ubiquinone) complex I, assembly factor 6 n=1 Tax=Wickerhamiella sorbophila TaxID=45607 RepID=A0A2T0FLB5_9ASCO|nr:NADH dehydrogenase (ubiquinone) complex I, assembly factor 6 [Wickerhamiella sorbophila]PRT55784.1 NADH dehydrogenase (ubiquinone) complex I, assembly factor 6 [Wickerhamiella sorbophila]
MVGVDAARRICREAVRGKDRSAYLLSQYMAGPAQDAYIGMRAFNIETARAADSAVEPKVARIKLEYWKAAIQKIHSATQPDVDPAVVLLHNASQAGASVARKYLLTIVQTRESQLAKKPLRNLEDMERFGEGVYSQLNYASLDILNAMDPETADYFRQNPHLDEKATTVAAHIGQASGIAVLLKSLTFYARAQSWVVLPAQSLAENHISQQAVLDAVESGSLSQLPDVQNAVFTAATRANDHLLTARSIFEELKQSVGVPQSLLLTAMSALPVSLYLERLEKVNFNVEKAHGAEWKLPYRSWRSYKTRKF